MKRNLKSFAAVAVLMLVILLYACSNGTQSESSLAEQSDKISANESKGKAIITFGYEKQPGYASNQFAVWIEDTDGNHIKTLYATRYTANGGYKDRPDSIPTWVAKSGLAEMQKSELDAIAGATPKAGTLSYAWDLTDASKNTVPSGDYKFYVEGSLRWKNRVIYSGVITIGDAPVEVYAEAEYIYESSDNQPALSDDSPEISMITAVTANFVPTAEK